MKPRSCLVRLWICNDAGKECCYSIKPLPRAELGQAVAGFFLTNLSADPSPLYAVSLFPDGLASCNCPQHRSAQQCKHADALMASGLLPSAFLAVLHERTVLLDEAEARLAAVSARASQLQTALAAIPPARPARRRAAKKAA